MLTLATTEGYTLQSDESFTDPYIDYRIYGIEPPE